MIGSAERIAEGDLTERAAVPDPASEVGHLGTALNTMLDRIEAAVDATTASEGRLRRFVADASHELRTPLTSIRGYAELHRRGADDPDAVALGMARIEAEATRMSELVEDLLVLARLDQGHPLRTEPVDVAVVARAAVEAAQAVEPHRHIDLTVPASPMVVLGDPGRLRQAVDNLLANVREHTDVTTSVQVEVVATGPAAVLRVADDGPGMSVDLAARAFERFCQGEPTIAHPRSGTGLGLAIVHDLVVGHGGTVALETAPGKGVTVQLSLPRLGADSQGTTSGIAGVEGTVAGDLRSKGTHT
jgi:two-component system OmpR family sensor kinase